ncbi:MAG: CDP-glucose 4,6-dehydratase [Betaproteobacteria bacterium]
MVAPTVNCWKGKRVLVTGHTGFKGGWLSLWLQKNGADVLGYALAPPTNPSLFESANVARGMQSVIGDIRDYDAVAKVMAGFRPEVVFHLAAQSLVIPSYADPIGTYATNVMGTVHLLEAARVAANPRAFVVVTSDKCYENSEWVWGYRESDPMGGRDPYSNSKGCAELVTAAFRQSYFSAPAAAASPTMALASARAGNVIGGGDWATDRLVPDFIRAMGKGEAIRVRRPKATRPWQHVLEPLSGYIRLAERLLGRDSAGFASGWNFGPAEADTMSVADLVQILCARWGADASFTLDEGDHPHEAMLLKLDCSKSRALLGWRPRLGVNSAIAWTVDWHKAQHTGADMRAFTLSQIEQFESTPIPA